jgi:hypothetical protein
MVVRILKAERFPNPHFAIAASNIYATKRLVVGRHLFAFEMMAA